MKKLFLILVALVSLAFTAEAQRQGGGPQQPSFEKFLQDKMVFIFHEMSLSESDSVKFAPLYLELQEAKMEMMKKYGGLRSIYRKIRHNEPVSEEEYTQVVLNEAERQSEEAKLDLTYITKFQSVLTGRQLYIYQMAERKYKEKIMSRGARNPQAK